MVYGAFINASLVFDPRFLHRPRCDWQFPDGLGTTGGYRTSGPLRAAQIRCAYSSANRVYQCKWVIRKNILELIFILLVVQELSIFDILLF